LSTQLKKWRSVIGRSFGEVKKDFKRAEHCTPVQSVFFAMQIAGTRDK
jgi:hypothetical protein